MLCVKIVWNRIKLLQAHLATLEFNGLFHISYDKQLPFSYIFQLEFIRPVRVE